MTGSEVGREVTELSAGETFTIAAAADGSAGGSRRNY